MFLCSLCTALLPVHFSVIFELGFFLTVHCPLFTRIDFKIIGEKKYLSHSLWHKRNVYVTICCGKLCPATCESLLFKMSPLKQF